jgi:DNA-binding SARP family transcriptional activator
MLEFRVLGPLEVEADGRLVHLGGQRQRALLANLLIHAGDVVSTDRLIDDLWGEQPPRTAGTSLQNAVSQLRKVLGADVVVTRAPGYALAVGPDQIDARRFERRVARARELEGAERARVLREALGLWRGRPLPEFAFEPFAESEIRRLEELRLVVLEDRLEVEVELGRHAEVVGELEAFLGEHRLRERPRALLMLALYRSGRQAEALQSYHDARRLLVEELGIEPSAELQRLHASILRQESALEPPGAAKPEQDHVAEVVRALVAGRLVPVLGPGALVLAAEDGGDVAAHLADSFECPAELRGALPRVSQYIAVTRGVGPLYDALHELFGREVEPAGVHRFLAGLPRLLRALGVPQQVVVATGYDRAVERAYADAGEDVDVVAYVASGHDRGKFVHRAPDGSERVIDVPNTYGELSLEDRPVILKIHGEADPRPERGRESFVVSEDDYIGYLTQTSLANVVPVTLAAKLLRSHFLFLGYPLIEWNLRVFLHRVFGDEAISYRSWAVEPAPDPLHREFWRRRDVDVLDAQLDEYVDELDRRLRATAVQVELE